MCGWFSSSGSQKWKEKKAVRYFQQGNEAYKKVYEPVYRGGGRYEDMVEAIQRFKKALALVPQGHHLRFNILRALVFAMLAARPGPNEFREIEHHFAELEKYEGNGLVKDQYRKIALDLGDFYGDQFRASMKRRASKDDLFDRSLAFYRKATSRYSDDPKDKVAALLSSAGLRLDRGGDEDFQNALAELEGARSICPTGELATLFDISRAFCEVHKARYRRLQQAYSLQAAISECDTTLKIPDLRQDQRQEALNDLVLCMRVLLDNHPSNAKVIAGSTYRGYLHEAFEAQPTTMDANTTPDTAKRAIMLADVLSHRTMEPEVEDLDKAISLYHRLHNPKPAKNAAMLRNLADATWLRCIKTKSFEGFSEVARLYEDAFNIDGTDDMAGGMAVIYLQRSGIHESEDADVGAEIADLEMARRYFLKAAELCPEGEDKQMFEDEARRIEDSVQLLREGRGERRLMSRSLSRTLERRCTQVRRPALLE